MKNNRRNFLKRAGAITAASAAAAIPVAQAAPTAEPLIEERELIVHTKVEVKHLLCIACGVQTARYPKNEPRLCADCRVFSYRKAVYDGLVNPSPESRKFNKLPPYDDPAYRREHLNHMCDSDCVAGKLPEPVDEPQTRDYMGDYIARRP